MPNKIIKGNTSKIKLLELEVVLVEQQIQKSSNITDFISIENKGTQYKTLLYHSGYKGTFCKVLPVKRVFGRSA
jgi:hypothetical protein